MFPKTKLHKIMVVVISVVGCVGIVVGFQNCAKAKYIDPDTRHSLIALGYCKPCEDNLGSGLACRTDQVSSFSSCNYESCQPGYRQEKNVCVVVACEAGAVATCTVPRGEGRMTCKNNGLGYGPCVAISCEDGYALADGKCETTDTESQSVGSPTLAPSPNPGSRPNPVPNPASSPEPGPNPAPAPSPEPSPNPSPESSGPTPTPGLPTEMVCTSNETRDCSTTEISGMQTCNNEGSAWGECVYGECKPGYYRDDNQQCVAHACEPTSVTPCTSGVGVGYKTCNSAGSGWGICVLNGCEAGYMLQSGVCVAQLCTPDSEIACEFDNGSGTRTCNAQGTDYGSCVVSACKEGYSLADNGKCKKNHCQPASPQQCRGESGSGTMYCFQNGQGYDSCVLDQCDQGFKLKHGICVDEDSCEDGERFACAGKNGTGFRACDTSCHKKAACVLTACNSGYEFTTDGQNTSCKKIKK
ncbi:MAG: hypothetical protein AB7O96_09745 [Pseudobdellovibrionaceae bacterium]